MKEFKNEIWQVKESSSKKDHYNIVGTVIGMKYKIATIPYISGETVSDSTGTKLKVEALKHAKLIAAAPDLLEALQKAIIKEPFWWIDAEAAISKAITI